MMWALQGAGKNKDPSMAEALVEKSFDLLKSGKIDIDHLSSILRNERVLDPFRKWEVLSGLVPDLSDGEVERISSEAVPEMIRANMSRAMTLLCTDAGTMYSVPVLSSAVRTMYEEDAKRANDWAVENLSRIDTATGQRVIVSIAQVAIRNGEYEAAAQWAGRLLDSGVRQQVQDQLESTRNSKLKPVQ